MSGMMSLQFILFCTHNLDTQIKFSNDSVTQTPAARNESRDAWKRIFSGSGDNPQVRKTKVSHFKKTKQNKGLFISS
jgi:hypothetical protein